MPSPAALELTCVSHAFFGKSERTEAVTDISLRVDQGEFLVLVGPSGCGKSTLLNLMAGFIRPTDGTISSFGETVVRPEPQRGMVFQQHRLFPWLNVRRNVAYGPKRLRLTPTDVTKATDEALALVGLTDKAKSATYELSGGQQQRVAIARALAARPQILLLDEPFSALDAITRENLQEELISIWKRTGITVVFVTHSIDEAVFMGTRVLVMDSNPGRFIAEKSLAFSSSEGFKHSRSNPEFGIVRDELSDLLRNKN